MNMLEPEFIVGSYRVIERIGSNGYTLFVAMHRILEKPAFLRRIPCHNCPPEIITRFIDEIRFLSRINHPNIVSIHDCFQLDTNLFLVTQYVDAPTLHDFLRQGQRMKPPELIHIAEQCLDALTYLLEMGCAHDDPLEPQKIFLLKSGQAMLDFPPMPHLLSLLAPDHEHRLGILCNLLYAAPEIIELGHRDTRSDLYSFGLVMYEALSGRNRRSFVSSAAGPELARFAVEGSLPPIRQIAPDVSISLANVIDSSIHRDPDHRFQTAKGLLEAFREIKTTSCGK